MAARLLIDTHIYIWMRTLPQRLTAAERHAVDGANAVLVSAVSIWETAMLLGRGRVPGGDQRLLSVPDGLAWLPIREEHCRELAGLPRMHRDPFDRMLIAQARSENLPLVTRDRAMQGYAQYIMILP